MKKRRKVFCKKKERKTGRKRREREKRKRERKEREEMLFVWKSKTTIRQGRVGICRRNV